MIPCTSDASFSNCVALFDRLAVFDLKPSVPLNPSRRCRTLLSSCPRKYGSVRRFFFLSGHCHLGSRVLCESYTWPSSVIHSRWRSMARKLHLEKKKVRSYCSSSRDVFNQELSRNCIYRVHCHRQDEHISYYFACDFYR